MRHCIRPPRSAVEAELFEQVRADLGKQLDDAICRSGLSRTAVSRLVFGDDKQTTLIRETIEGGVDPHLVTLIRYAIATDHSLEISLVPKDHDV